MSTGEKTLEGAPEDALGDAISLIYEAQAIVAVCGYAVTNEETLATETTRARISNALSGAEKLLDSAGDLVGGDFVRNVSPRAVVQS